MSRKHPKSCSGKKRYRDSQEAKLALQHLGTFSERDRVPVRWYDCSACGGVHISSQREWTFS